MTRGEEIEAAAQAIAEGAEVRAAREARHTVVVIVIGDASQEGEPMRVACGCAIRASLPRDVVLASIDAIVESLDAGGGSVSCRCPQCLGGLVH